MCEDVDRRQTKRSGQDAPLARQDFIVEVPRHLTSARFTHDSNGLTDPHRVTDFDIVGETF